ncbi:MAG: hypothetical protein Q8R00_04900 [Candidatus Nanoarchaeia archaeon]|nr:hypothetical protein [Candidatus Nanoarchaeia archaeon]
MNKSYLITRPEHDDTTYYLSKWNENTLDVAKRKGMKTFDLHQEKANKSEVESRLKKLNPDLIVFNGHGSEDTVTGHQQEPIIIADKNDDLLKSKIIFALSCKSAKVLGPKSVEKGAISYSGFSDDFVFLYDQNKITRPTEDKTAKLFLEPPKIFIEALIKGNTVLESSKRAEKKMEENIVKSLGHPEDANLVRFLWWDLKHFTSHGDLNASL